MQIHQVTPDEWRVWRDIRLEALASDPAEFGSTLAREQAYEERDWRSKLADGLKVVALDSEPHAGSFRSLRPHAGTPRVVGMVASAPEPEGLYLYSMWVRDSHRGRGVGEALVKAVLAWAGEHGWRIVRLRVWEDNLPARKLYRRLGFVNTDEPEHMECRVS